MFLRAILGFWVRGFKNEPGDKDEGKSNFRERWGFFQG
jgi:hypothetical protein